MDKINGHTVQGGDQTLHIGASSLNIHHVHTGVHETVVLLLRVIHELLQVLIELLDLVLLLVCDTLQVTLLLFQGSHIGLDSGLAHLTGDGGIDIQCLIGMDGDTAIPRHSNGL